MGLDAKVMKEFHRLNIQLRPLFFLQEKLDEKIKARYDYDDYLRKEHFNKKVIGIRVEIAELINALRFHKYWSKKLPMEKKVILEEYVDGLHMILSLGIEKQVTDYSYQGIYDEELTAEDLTFIFDRLLTLPWGELRKNDFKLGLELYLKLGELLLFSWDEIKEAYAQKNIHNHERQEEGY